MNKNIFQTCRSITCVCLILMIVLIQFPAVSLALDFGKSGDLSAVANPKTLESNFSDDLIAAPSASFSNTNTITVVDRSSSANPPGLGSPYPSPITVSGLSGTITDVNVTLSGWTSGRPRDMDVLLVAPTGEKFIIMSDVGGTSTCSISNVNITLDDSAAGQFPDYETTVCPAGGLPSGTYRPTNYTFSSEPAPADSFPSPAPAAPYSNPAPTGAATFASVFNGLSPNGTWNLYVVDDALGNTPAGGTSSFSGGWSLDITTSAAAAATTTTISSSQNPSLRTQSVNFTATVTSGGSAVTTGTVSFTQNGTAIAGCTNVAVNGSGQAICTAAANTLPEGTLTITATYSGTATLATSNASLSQVVNSPTVVTGSQFCNNGGVTIPDPGAANVYPANIVVSGLVGTITKVTTQVNGFTEARPSNIDVQLVGPTNAAFQFMSDGGDAVNAVNNINLTFDDAAASALPNGTALSGGTYRPTDHNAAGETDSYPAPAPSTFSRPESAGTATFASVYNSTNPNGTWRIYAVDDSIGGGASTIGGLCLNFTVAKLNTTTTVTSSANPSQQMQSVTFTATVNSSQTPSGSVQFFDGATSLGIVALNGSGQATLTTSTLAAGNRNITVQYLGANVGAGGGGYNASASGTLVQVVRIATAATVNVGGRVLTAAGRGVSKATVTLTDAGGNVRYAVTNPFGYYRFAEVAVGESYALGVKAKNAQFVSRVMVINEETNNLNFVARE